MLTQGPSSPWPQIAQIAAIIKFTLILLGLLYIFGRILKRYLIRNRSPEA